MSLSVELAKIFEERGWTWTIEGQKNVQPTEHDFEAALDEAARVMYSEPVGSQLEVGRLIIIKTHTGHDVYALAGTFI